MAMLAHPTAVPVPQPEVLQTTPSPSPSPSELEAEWRQALSNKIILGHATRTVTIGRSSACMLQIGSKATTISRRHAEIQRAGSGYQLRVLGSNGVRVNGTLHMRDSRVAVGTGDEINFVGVRFRFRAPVLPATPTPLSVPVQRLGGKLHDEDAVDDWWPEPVRKRGVDGCYTIDESCAAKRLRTLASEDAELYGNSTDTLVGASEAGGLGGEYAPLQKKLYAQHIIDCLPPSSPPLMSSFMADDDAARFGESDLDDELPEVASVLALPKEQPADKPATQESRHHETESKENQAPETGPAAHTAAKKSSTQATGEPAKLSAAKTPARPVKTPRVVKPSKPRKRADDEMMASLRELLGVVDPSECLANALDSETEDLLQTEPQGTLALPAGASLVDLLVQTMVFSARTSHTISDLLRDMAHADGPEAALWRHHITWTLFHNACFGRVERRVKDASDRRAEDKWYYDASKDECPERKANFGGLVRTARRCTLRDTQYFFKQVPKLPSFRYK
ncbi:hypothetical protein GGI07_000313 [Coemansia sp. Benny D115]|nr:hypothetical protein GGI07_000313 [Coemansia sp. Benny D115]